MIEKNELRIGNLFMGGLDEILEVTAIGPRGVDYKDLRGTGQGSCTFVGCKPIPISEEWLLKFGFYYARIDLYGEDWYEKIYGRSRLEVVYFDSDGIYPERDYEIRFDPNLTGLHMIDNGNNIEYVHQLQNLFHALVGTELTIIPASEPPLPATIG